MDFTCQDALPLVPSYLDGELSQARAGLLRKHLLDCQACRASAQDSKSISRWFVQPARAEFAAPSGFAARVSRRAFAGDTGSLEVALPAPRGTAGRSSSSSAQRRRRCRDVISAIACAIRVCPLPTA
jgi:anti-sigma factor RsiW